MSLFRCHRRSTLQIYYLKSIQTHFLKKGAKLGPQTNFLRWLHPVWRCCSIQDLCAFTCGSANSKSFTIFLCLKNEIHFWLSISLPDNSETFFTTDRVTCCQKLDVLSHVLCTINGFFLFMYVLYKGYFKVDISGNTVSQRKQTAAINISLHNPNSKEKWAKLGSEH